jgi:orotidine-5'-phosphate decarboxylase
MNRKSLIRQIQQKQSYLIVGLDTDFEKIPAKYRSHAEYSGIYYFNKDIIDATSAYAVGYKLNLAFYEAYGIPGMQCFVKTVEYLKTNYPDMLVIADAKRNDIGNTAAMYAKAFFERYNADAITVNPYMGKDSVNPFLKYENKWTILLALTSNSGAEDFQFHGGCSGAFCQPNLNPLYIEVIKKAISWGSVENTMFVIGGTQPQYINIVRQIASQHFLLIPGIGAQGGSLEEVSKHGLIDDFGLLVNSSRNIIFASNGDNFAAAAAVEAQKVQQEMAVYLSKYC